MHNESLRRKFHIVAQDAADPEIVAGAVPYGIPNYMQATDRTYLPMNATNSLV